jgi:hypothetical protein
MIPHLITRKSFYLKVTIKDNNNYAPFVVYIKAVRHKIALFNSKKEMSFAYIIIETVAFRLYNYWHRLALTLLRFRKVCCLW